MYKISLLLVVYLGLPCALAFTRTLLTQEPEATGARCLDGSSPGYYMRAGSGDGANKWVLHLMGGAWCTNTTDCYDRSFTLLGTTTAWPKTNEFFGIFSNDETVNPDFYNWNAVFFIYCDGGSFAGDREDPETYQGRNLYYRGYRNLQAIIRHLNEERGLTDATDVLLTGCSAGGLATFLHADFVRTLIPQNANFKALPDAGYFIDVPNFFGVMVWMAGFTQLMTLQNIDDALIPACRADNNGTLWRCLIGPYIYDYIRTPLFVLNSQYDSTVLEGAFLLPCTPPDCDIQETAALQRYKAEFDRQVEPILNSPSQNGYFLDSCYIHCQTIENNLAWNQVAINGRTIAQAIGDWYFERSTNTRLKDCDDEFPCNPTCPESGAVTNIASPYLLALTLFMMLSSAWLWN